MGILWDNAGKAFSTYIFSDYIIIKLRLIKQCFFTLVVILVFYGEGVIMLLSEWKLYLMF